MFRLLLIFAVLFSACGEVAKKNEQVSHGSEKVGDSLKVIDFTHLNPEDIEIQIFDNPYLENDLIFRNRDPSFRKSRRFLTKNDAEQKGFFIWDDGEWKAHGRWFFFKDGILELRNAFRFGVKVGEEAEYDRFGAFISSVSYDVMYRYRYVRCGRARGKYRKIISPSTRAPSL